MRLAEGSVQITGNRLTLAGRAADAALAVQIREAVAALAPSGRGHHRHRAAGGRHPASTPSAGAVDRPDTTASASPGRTCRRVEAAIPPPPDSPPLAADLIPPPAPPAPPPLLPPSLATAAASVAQAAPPPPAAPAPRPNCSVLIQTALEGDRILFDYWRAEQKAEHGAVLDRLAAAIQRCAPDERIEIAGHADIHNWTGGNQKLSEDRAAIMRDELLKRGVAPGSLVVVGYAATKPVADNDSEAGRALNRRVEFHVRPRS